jgi:hypothetical protein
MKRYRFAPDQSFAEVRRLIDEIDSPEHKGMVAKLIWREGTAKDQEVTYYYDEMAERFGHIVDKSAIHSEVLTSLYVGIPVDIQLAPKPEKPATRRVSGKRP